MLMDKDSNKNREKNKLVALQVTFSLNIKQSGINEKKT